MAKHWLERAVDWSSRVETEWGRQQRLTENERIDKQLRSGQLFEVKEATYPTSGVAGKAEDERQPGGQGRRGAEAGRLLETGCGPRLQAGEPRSIGVNADHRQHSRSRYGTF